MSNAWAETQEKAERQAEKGGIFVRLKDNGDKVVGAFCGDPFAKEVVWTGQRYEEFDANKAEHKGERTSLKVSLKTKRCRAGWDSAYMLKVLNPGVLSI